MEAAAATRVVAATPVVVVVVTKVVVAAMVEVRVSSSQLPRVYPLANQKMQQAAATITNR
jgi:hypothetical protein